MAKLPEIKSIFVRLLSLIVLLMLCNLIYLNYVLFTYIRSDTYIANPDVTPVISPQDTSQAEHIPVPDTTYAKALIKLGVKNTFKDLKHTDTIKINEEWKLFPTIDKMMIESR